MVERESEAAGGPEPGALIGEVVATSTTAFTAQVDRLDGAPPFGSFVKVRRGADEVYAVVGAVRIGPLDPGARPVLRGRAGVRDEAIYAEHPDLVRLLRCEFEALVVAHTLAGRFRPYLPPFPPPLHYSVYLCTAEESRRLSEDLGYLRTVLNASGLPVDEVVAANLRWAAEARGWDLAFLLRAGRELAALLPEEYDRLAALLRRLVP
jgi:hypothetical protein